MRTTLTLDSDVIAKLRGEMRRSGRPFKEVVNALLRLAFNLQQKTPHPKPFKVHAHPMGLKEGLTSDNIGELLDRTEGPSHS